MTTCPSCGWEWNPVKPALSMREAETLKVLVAWEEAGNKTGPTFRELSRACGVSVTRIHAAVHGLINKGYAVFVHNHARSLRSAGL